MKNKESIKKSKGKRAIALLLSAMMLFSPIGDSNVLSTSLKANAAEIQAVSSFSKVGGWFESIYAEIGGVSVATVTEVSYSGAMSGSLSATDLSYLVRSNGNGGVRIDIPGLKAGTYTLSVKVSGQTITESGIVVRAYDRSGYAHFKYTKGVGAYNDDGTLKSNAIVLYVTDTNKNSVQLSYGGTTVTGIGNILNSSSGSNRGILKKMAAANVPLAVRFIGIVSESGLYEKGEYDAGGTALINGLSAYMSTTNGGSAKDNGHMARMSDAKDITIEGIGSDAVIDGWGFHFIAGGSYGESFEARNLSFINTPEDALGMEGKQSGSTDADEITAPVERCWVHNNNFYCPHILNPAENDKAEGDGSMDFKRGQYMTCSYNYFEGCHKTNLVGSDDGILQFNLSYHHNYWYYCDQRGPLSRNANIHMYNNFTMYQTGYSQNTRANAYIFSEYNMFYLTKNPQDVIGGAIKSYKDSLAGIIWNKATPGTVVESKTEYVPNACQYKHGGIQYNKFDVDSNLSYIPNGDYELQTDYTTLRKVLFANNGVMKANPKTPEEVTDDEINLLSSFETVDFGAETKTVNPGKVAGTPYVFTVATPFSMSLTYNSGTTGTLVNSVGVNLMEGDGALENLQPGTYAILSPNILANKYSDGKPFSCKDTYIQSLTVVPASSDTHFHVWELDTTKSVAATCTTAGKNVYKCKTTATECPLGGTKEETVEATGHDYSTSWTVDVADTETTAGQKSHHCKNCEAKKDITVIPAGTTAASLAGAHEMNFIGSKENDPDDFFEVSGNFSNSKGEATYNGITYKECLKIESSTSLTFTTAGDAKLVMVFAGTEGGSKIKVDGVTYTADDNGVVEADLTAGDHSLGRVDGINLFYICVSGAGSSTPTPTNYTLTLSYNYSGSPAAVTKTVASGTSYTNQAALLPSGFTREGYTFAGFYQEAGCTNAVSYPVNITADVTYYAKWTQNQTEPDPKPTETVKHSVDFSKEAADSITGNTTYADYFTVHATTGTGADGTKYYMEIKDASGKNALSSYGVRLTDTTIPGNEDGLLKAIEFTAQGAGTLTIEVAKSSTDGTSSITLAKAGNDGSLSKITSKDTAADKTKTTMEFTIPSAGKYYFYPEGTKGVIYYTITVEEEVASEPDPVEYTVTVNKADGSATTSFKVEENTQVTKTQVPDPTRAGYEFTGWVDAQENAVAIPFVATKDITLTATWSKIPVEYTITVDKADGTATSSFKVLENAQVTKTQVPDPTRAGYEFTGWVDAQENAVTIPFVATKDVTLTATWSKIPVEYTITVDKADGTTTTTIKALENTQVTKTELPDPTRAGYEFICWVDAQSNEVVIPFTVTKDMTLTATWREIIPDPVKYTITVDKGDGTETTSFEVVEGDALTSEELPTPTREGYTFNGWTVNDEAITLPYIPAGNVAIVASWTQNSGEGPGNEPGPGTDPDPVVGEGIVIIGLEPTYEFTGAKILPNIAVVDYDVEGGKVLAPKTDYTVTYKDNVKVNAVETDENDIGYKLAPGAKYATITITGKGNYASKDTTKTFLITPAPVEKDAKIVELKGCKIAKLDAVPYTGRKQYPSEITLTKGKESMTYKYNGTTYVAEDEDQTEIPAVVTVSNNINAGTATVLLTGDVVKGKATTLKATFKITPVDLSTAGDKLKINAEKGEYNVKGAIPESITVTYDGTTLRNGVDYTVKYGANKKATGEVATATITVTGKGNYTKKAPVQNYTIDRLVLADKNIVAVKAFDGMKAGKVTAVVVDNTGNTLKPAQYTIKVYDGEEEMAATAVLTKEQKIRVVVATKDDVNLTGNATSICTVGVDFSKVKADIKKVPYINPKNGKVSQVTKTWIYTGSPITLNENPEKPEDSDLVVTLKGVGNLEQNNNYEIVSYSNNVNKGTATVTLRGKGIYSGYKVVKFKIVSKTMTLKKDNGDWEDIKDIFSIFSDLWD